MIAHSANLSKEHLHNNNLYSISFLLQRLTSTVSTKMYIHPGGGFVKHGRNLEGIHMRCSKMLIPLLVMVGSSANAQGSGATDNELYAAFCKGAMSALDQGIPAVQQMEQRLTTYLWTTGAMTDPKRRNAVLGIGAAMTRGRTDQQHCSATLLACNDAINDAPRGKRSTPTLKGDPGLQLLACMERDASCPRVMRCQGPDALPF